MKALKGFSSDRRMEEGGSDSGVLKTGWQLPVGPDNPSGPWKHRYRMSNRCLGRERVP